jgi:hypothetical protein
LPPGDPVRQRAAGQPRAVLLLRRVDEWIDVLDDLLSLLGPLGLEGGDTRVPVVLTAADVREVKNARDRLGGRYWIRFLPLDRLAGEEDANGAEVDPAIRDEDILAYQWWLLNPKANEQVYALSRTAPPRWEPLLRLYVRNARIYPEVELYEFVKKAPFIFTPGDDNVLLSTYARIL